MLEHNRMMPLKFLEKNKCPHRIIFSEVNCHFKSSPELFTNIYNIQSEVLVDYKTYASEQ